MFLIQLIYLGFDLDPGNDYTKFNFTMDDILDAINNTLCSLDMKINYAEECDCPKACQHYSYSKSPSQALWPHTSYQRAFYNKYVKDSEEYKELDHHDEYIEEKKSKVLDMDYIKEHFLQVNVYFDELSYMEINDQPASDFVNSLATIGGALNLWIGVTFMTLVELFELLYNLLYMLRLRVGQMTVQPSAINNGVTMSSKKTTPVETTSHM